MWHVVRHGVILIKTDSKNFIFDFLYGSERSKQPEKEETDIMREEGWVRKIHKNTVILPLQRFGKSAEK